MTSNKSGFTLIELMVVVAMIAILTTAMSGAVTSAMERARFHRATNDVKIITQAILAYENEDVSGSKHELPELDKADCDKKTLGFLLGDETDKNGKIPVLLFAALTGNGVLMDPWHHPYKVTIKKSSNSASFETMKRNLQSGFLMPNAYRLQREER